MIDLTFYILLFATLFTLFIHAFVWGQRRKNRLNRAFLFYSGTIFSTAFFDLVSRIVSEPLLLVFVARLNAAVFFLTAMGTLFFVYALTGRAVDRFFRIVALLTCTAIAISLLGPLVLKPLYTASGSGGRLIPTTLFAILFICTATPVATYTVIVSLFSYTRTKEQEHRTRLITFSVAIAVSFFYLLIISIIFPVFFHVKELVPFTPLAVVIIDLFSYYSIRSKNFFTVNVTQMEEVLDKVFKNTPDALLLLNQQGKIVRFNNAAIKLFAVNAQAMNKVALHECIDRYSYDAQYEHFETTAQIGSTSIAVAITQKRLEAADETLHSLLWVRDITEKKRLEEEQRRAQHMDSIGVLAGGIAHDFNNYLAGIISSFSLAKMNVDATTQTATILTQGERAALAARGLTQQLLTFSKGGTPVLEVFDVIELLIETFGFVSSGKPVKAEWHLPQEPVYLFADAGQIRQVFNNVIMNACQAMSDGGTIRFFGRVLHDTSGEMQPQFSLDIMDDGHGIAPEIATRIFDPYFSTRKSGTGLGLAVAHTIINKHKGTISISSREYHGTTCTISLPVHTGVVQAPARDTAKAPVRTGRVLIMDDVEVIRVTLSLMLERLGFSVECAGDGEEALRLFTKAQAAGTPYMLVISDLTVADGYGGTELVKRIREIDNKVPVIVSSGYSDNDEIARYRQYGFSAVLRKPYTVDDVHSVLVSVT